jgi:hypothetical protein
MKQAISSKSRYDKSIQPHQPIDSQFNIGTLPGQSRKRQPPDTLHDHLVYFDPVTSYGKMVKFERFGPDSKMSGTTRHALNGHNSINNNDIF